MAHDAASRMHLRSSSSDAQEGQQRHVQQEDASAKYEHDSFMISPTSFGDDGVDVSLSISDKVDTNHGTRASEAALVIPLFVALVGLLYTLTRMKKREKSINVSVATSSEQIEPLLPSLPSANASGTQSTRFQSLDVFRGITVCLMIFVNYGGDGCFRECYLILCCTFDCRCSDMSVQVADLSCSTIVHGMA